MLKLATTFNAIGEALRCLSYPCRTSFPEIVASMQDLPNIALDGELVVLNDLGVPQFERLRWRSLMRQPKEVNHASSKEPAAIFAFDLLSLKGKEAVASLV